MWLFGSRSSYCHPSVVSSMSLQVTLSGLQVTCHTSLLTYLPPHTPSPPQTEKVKELLVMTQLTPVSLHLMGPEALTSCPELSLSKGIICLQTFPDVHKQ